jgi:hypothetical protein
VAQQRPEEPGALLPPLQVALVVLLGAPEGRRRLDRGHDRIPQAPLHSLDHPARRLRLLVGVGEDHRAVLVADVRALPVELRGVVDLEVLRHQVLVAHLVRVEGHLGDLDVTRVARAHLLVGRVVDVPALIADGRLDDAVELAKRIFDLPEAARSEGRLLGPFSLVGHAY